MEKLNVKVVSFSVAMTAGILSLLCALLIAVFGAGFTSMMGYLFHTISLESMKPLTIISVVIGFIDAIVIGAVTGALFGIVYNWFAKAQKA